MTTTSNHEKQHSYEHQYEYQKLLLMLIFVFMLMVMLKLILYPYSPLLLLLKPVLVRMLVQYIKEVANPLFKMPSRNRDGTLKPYNLESRNLT